VLEVDPTQLPSQVLIEVGKGKRYHNALCEYLIRHHRLMYYELQTSYQTEGLTVSSHGGYHLLSGTTVRTANNGYHHVVVGMGNEVVWDPHPSRAGLLEVLSWGIMAGATEAFVEDRYRRKALMEDPSIFFCYCPACGGRS
jgi:hypothetical protein